MAQWQTGLLGDTHASASWRIWRRLIPFGRAATRAVEFTASNKGDSPMLSHLLDQIPPDEQIGTSFDTGALPHCNP